MSAREVKCDCLGKSIKALWMLGGGFIDSARSGGRYIDADDMNTSSHLTSNSPCREKCNRTKITNFGRRDVKGVCEPPSAAEELTMQQLQLYDI